MSIKASLLGLTRQSILLRKKMDARVKPAHDEFDVRTIRINRRAFVTLISTAAWPLAARAQQADKMRRVGVLVGLAAGDPNMQARLAGFRQGLEKRGWSEGRNVSIDYRYAPAGAHTQLLAKELVALHPDVMLAHGTVNTAALR